MRSNKHLVSELRTSSELWIDAAIVVAFRNRFEFVHEGHPDPEAKLSSLQRQGGLAVGLAGLLRGDTEQHFASRLFREYVSESWAQRYMELLHGIIREHGLSQE